MKKLEQRLRRALFMVPYLAKKGYAGALVSEAAAAIGTTPEELRNDVHRLSQVGVPDGDPGQYLTLWIEGSGANARIGADTVCRLKKPPRLTLHEALALHHPAPLRLVAGASRVRLEDRAARLLQLEQQRVAGVPTGQQDGPVPGAHASHPDDLAGHRGKAVRLREGAKVRGMAAWVSGSRSNPSWAAWRTVRPSGCAAAGPCRCCPPPPRWAP